MRLVAYIRVSKTGGREGDSFQSPDQQREAITHAVALRQGAELVAEFVDLDQSGAKMSRPGFDQALGMLNSGEADGIVVAKLDRFARNAAAIDLIESLEAGGKVFISATDNFDTSTPTGRFALGLMVLVARLQRDQLRESLANSARRAIERGVHTRVPYGYMRSHGRGSRLTPSEPEASVVRRIFTERAGGSSIAAIADALNADEIPAATGGAWTRQTVRLLLRTRTYLGEAAYCEHTTIGAHPALIDPDIFDACQWERPAGLSKGGSLLAGLVRCAGCGYVMGASSSRGARRYNCQRHTREGQCPSPTTAPAEKLEELITSAFLDRFGSSAVTGAEVNPELEAAGRDVERAEREYAAWRDDHEMRDLIGGEDYRAGLLARKAATDNTRQAHDRLIRERAAHQLTVSDDVWADLTVPERRELLRAGIDAVVLRRAASTRTPLASRVFIRWAHQPDHEAALAA